MTSERNGFRGRAVTSLVMNTTNGEEVLTGIRDVLNARSVAFSAVFGAAVAVATIAIPINIGFGYFNLGEVLIYTAAFLFGPVVGALAGGVGAAAADIHLGYMVWAPITFVLKFLEGGVVGLVAGESTRSKVVAVLLGAPIMIGGYFLAAVYFQGLPYALYSELPIDLLQAGIGLAIALPLSKAVEARVPQLK